MEKEDRKAERMGWSSSQSSTNSGEKSRIVKCACGLISPVRVAGTKRNSGRRFMGCGRYGKEGSCNFFEWVDYPIGEREGECAVELADKVKTCEEEVEKGIRKIRLLELQLQTAIEVGERLMEENMKLKSKLSGKQKKCNRIECGIICGVGVLLLIITIIALV